MSDMQKNMRSTVHCVYKTVYIQSIKPIFYTHRVLTYPRQVVQQSEILHASTAFTITIKGYQLYFKPFESKCSKPLKQG